MNPPSLLVVTPVFEDVEASARLFAEIARTCGPGAMIVAVDDGSVRQPLGIGGLEAAGLRGVVLRLRRNVGHQRAIAAGLAYVAEHHPDAHRIVVMDSDGEDVPATIPDLLAPLESPGIDVVVAHRRSRVESLRFKLFYTVYKWLFKLLTGRAISFGNFMAMGQAGLQRLVAMGELGTHVAATVLLSRLRWTLRPLDRGPRYAGRSGMGFVGLVLHGFRAVMVFSEDVLVRVGLVCTFVAGMSLLGSTAAIVLKSVGIATPGWFSVALGILVLVFLQTGAITLMTLMMTGIMRSAAILPLDYRALVGEVLAADGYTPP